MASVVIEVFLANYNVEAVITLPDCLTATELSLLRMLMQGMSVTEIARRRNRSTKTVSFQKSQIFRKLKVRNDITFWLDMQHRYHLIIRRVRETLI